MVVYTLVIHKWLELDLYSTFALHRATTFCFLRFLQAIFHNEYIISYSVSSYSWTTSSICITIPYNLSTYCVVIRHSSFTFGQHQLWIWIYGTIYMLAICQPCLMWNVKNILYFCKVTTPSFN